MIEVNLAALDRAASYFDSFMPNVGKAMSFALNRVIPGKARSRYERDMLLQTAFPPGYLDSRVTVTQLSTPESLEARLVGRDRPTSLARFAAAGIPGELGVTVTVNPGNTKRIQSAFLVRLNRGASLTDEGFNLGLAIRLKLGQTLGNKKDTSKLVYLAKNVVLLYGPSVGQVLDDVAVEDEDAVVADIMDEFDRQFVRLM